MDAVKFLKERSRMCEHSTCQECLISNFSNCEGHDYPELAVEIVENWSKENPVKTYLSALLEKLPNVPMGEYGYPKFCPNELFGGEYREDCNSAKCTDCWNREYKEEN